MAQVSGVDIKVALYQETAFGVDPGTPDGRIAYFNTLNLKASQEMIDNPILAGGRGIPRSGRGNLDVSGSLDTTLAPETVGFWLKQLLGAPTTVGASSPYTHTFKPGALPAGFIVEKDYTAKLASKVERFNGLRVSGATFDFPQSGYAGLSLDLAGKRYSINAAPLDATLTDPGHTGWTGFKGIVKQGGTQIGGVLSGKLTVDNEMDNSLYCFPASGETAGERFALPEGRAKISGSLDLVFQDFTLLDLAKAGTSTSVEFLFTHGTGAGTAGNESLSFLLNNIDIPLTTPTIETRSGLKLSLSFTAFQSGSDLGLTVVLKNALAAAAL